MNAESSSWFWWSSLFALTAASGGIVLLVGLFWEKRGEPKKETFSSLTEYLSAKKIKKRGEIWVIWGVVIEIATGFGFSIKEAVKAHKIDVIMAQTETNLTKIESETPGEMPVRSATASAEIQFSSFFNGPPKQLNDQNLSLCLMGSNPSQNINLQGVSHVLFGGLRTPTGGVVPLNFALKLGEMGSSLPEQNKSADEVIKNLKYFVINNSSVFGEGTNEISGGSVTLVLNGSVSKTFLIPPQKCNPSHPFIETRPPR
jgi:hypothetical protein